MTKKFIWYPRILTNYKGSFSFFYLNNLVIIFNGNPSVRALVRFGQCKKYHREYVIIDVITHVIPYERDTAVDGTQWTLPMFSLPGAVGP